MGFGLFCQANRRSRQFKMSRGHVYQVIETHFSLKHLDAPWTYDFMALAQYMNITYKKPIFKKTGLALNKNMGGNYVR
jgi:hypothetical protein